MKTAPYVTERDLALIDAFKRELRTRAILDLDKIFAYIATEVPAPRFYISEERAVRIIKYHQCHGRWLTTRQLKRRMLEEIERRALHYLDGRQADNIIDAIYMAVNDPAPSFYLSPHSVRTYIYNTLSLCKK